MMRVVCMVALSVALAPFESLAVDDRADAAGFIERARHHIGRRVVLDHSHLVFATPEELTCVGIRTETGASDVPSVGRLLIHVAEADAHSRTLALARCQSGALGDACDVSISGEVFDASPRFGLDEARIIGLREATIRWPN